MNLLQFKAVFILVTAIIALLVASPALQKVLVYPQTEFFTELSLLGPEHKAENYPYDISNRETYTVFLDIGNQLGSCAYYQVQVKFRNETQSAPDSFNRTYSSLPSLYDASVFIADNEQFELPVSFALDYSFVDTDRIVFWSMKVNDVGWLNLNSLSSERNSNGAFYGNLIFELWIYNSTIGNFQYHERFVDLKLNMIVTEPIIS